MRSYGRGSAVALYSFCCCISLLCRSLVHSRVCVRARYIRSRLISILPVLLRIMWLRHSALFVVLAAHGGGAAYLNTYTGNSTKLKALLIDGYDPTTPAMGIRDPSANIFGSAAGTDVRMLLRIYKVVKVDPAQGMMSLRTNLVLEWTDKRLSWNPDDYGGVPEVYFNAHGVHDLELTQIWTPDLVLLNSVDGETTSFVPSLAKVKDDGSVQWNRKGDVHVLCRFSGLSAFPFDSLKCQAVFGAVALSEAVQGIGPANPDFSFLDEADLPGSHSDCHFYHPTLEPELLQAYAEYDITNISCAKAVDYTTGKSLIKYTVTFKRSSSFYGMMVLLPSVLFSYMSFVAFFMCEQARSLEWPVLFARCDIFGVPLR